MSKEPGTGIMGTKRGRASRAFGQLWQVPMFFVGLFAFLTTALTAPLRQDQTLIFLDDDIQVLRAGLEPGAEKPNVLVAQAENLLARLSEYPRRAAEIHFLAGSAYFRLAERALPDQAAGVRAKAIHHFEEARAIGVAANDHHPLLFRLGLTIYWQGREMQRAVDLMAQSVEKGADQPSRGYGVLAEAYMKLAKPSLDAALAANQKQLELTEASQIEEVAKARLTRGQLLFKKDQRLEALKELDRISPKAPKEVRFEGRVLQTQICTDEGLWRRAIPFWKELLADAGKVPGGKGRILYSLGKCYLNDEPSQRDEAIAAWKEAVELGGEAGQAAALRLGDLKIYGTPADVKAAIETWDKALSAVRVFGDYENAIVPLPRAREMLENACRFFLEAHEHDRTIQVAEIYKRIAAPGNADEWIAQAAEGWARSLKEKAKGVDDAEAKRLGELARTQFHRAGVGYEQAAATREAGQAELFWRSAQCYLAAKDFTQAATALDKFVRLEKSEMRLAEAWFLLAEAHTSQESKDLARQAYYKCIEYPATPFAYRARYKLALEEIDKKNWEQAKAILQQNLNDPSPLMDRVAHENSLYLMGQLLLQLNQFDQAALYYKEATRQYPNNPKAFQAKDKLAECYLRLAEQAEKKAAASQGEETKTHHERTRHGWLEKAALAYQELGDELESRARHKPLAVPELHLLRKALFGAADARYDIREFFEAVRRYQALQERYRRQVESLIACQRIWRCYSAMQKMEEGPRVKTIMLESLKLAQTDLEMMDAESPAFQGGAGVWRKGDWQNWLRFVSNTLAATPAAARSSLK